MGYGFIDLLYVNNVLIKRSGKLFGQIGLYVLLKFLWIETFLMLSQMSSLIFNKIANAIIFVYIKSCTIYYYGYSKMHLFDRKHLYFKSSFNVVPN